MKTQFVEGCKTAAQARKACPWAAKVIKVEGGYRCFESVTDWKTAKNQK